MATVGSKTKELVHGGLRALGVSARRVVDPFDDMVRLAPIARPHVIDVGANEGQTVRRFKRSWPDAVIHAFEPSPKAFEILTRTSAGLEDVHLVQAGVGSARAETVLIENSNSNMSSILPLGPAGWGAQERRTPIRLESLDNYASKNAIDNIAVLKTDTQGYDLEVLKGASGLLASHRIRMVYVEVTFSNMYQGAPPVDEVFRFLRELGFRLVNLYDLQVQDGMLSWGDALFVDGAKC